MKQFRIIWLPIIGSLFLVHWIFKEKTIPMYLDEFVWYNLYQFVMIIGLLKLLNII